MNKTKGSGRTRRGDEYRCALSKANRENEQLKADKLELVEALELIKKGCEDDEAMKYHGWLTDIVKAALDKANR